MLQNVSFAATNTDILPKLDPDGLNDCAAAGKHGQLQTQVSQLARQVETLTNIETSNLVAPACRLNEQLNELHTAVHTQFPTLTTAYTRLADALRNGTLASTSTSSKAEFVDRSRNIVMTGTEENRDSTVWCNVVTRVLHKAAGRDVQTSDMYRLGCFTEG